MRRAAAVTTTAVRAVYHARAWLSAPDSAEVDGPAQTVVSNRLVKEVLHSDHFSYAYRVWSPNDDWALP